MTGTKRETQEISWEKSAFTTVIVFCFLMHEGRILLITRAKEPYKGTRTIPGGKKTRNESLKDACVRAMEEETGLSVKNPSYSGLLHDMREGDKTEYLSAYFTANDFDGELKPSEEGALEWVDFEESVFVPGIHPSYAALFPLIKDDKKPFIVTLTVNAKGENQYSYE
jgi:8-oxo-dGTP diphosphatase